MTAAAARGDSRNRKKKKKGQAQEEEEQHYNTCSGKSSSSRGNGGDGGGGQENVGGRGGGVVDVNAFMQVVAPESRLSCAACSLLGKLLYPPGPLQLPPNPRRPHPPPAFPTAPSYHHTPRPPLSPPPTLLSPSSALSSPAFSLDFLTSSPHPTISCHIDQLHKDLALHLQLQRDHHHHPQCQYPPQDAHHNPTSTTLDLPSTLHPSTSMTDITNHAISSESPPPPPTDTPHSKRPRLKVELFRTSDKGFGIRILQSVESQSDTSILTESISSHFVKDSKDVNGSRSSIVLSEFNMPTACESPNLDHLQKSNEKLATNQIDDNPLCNSSIPSEAF